MRFDASLRRHGSGPHQLTYVDPKRTSISTWLPPPAMSLRRRAHLRRRRRRGPGRWQRGQATQHAPTVGPTEDETEDAGGSDQLLLWRSILRWRLKFNRQNKNKLTSWRFVQILFQESRPRLCHGRHLPWHAREGVVEIRVAVTGFCSSQQKAGPVEPVWVFGNLDLLI